MSAIKDGWYTDSVKPPIGLIPERIHEVLTNRKRIVEICAAVERYDKGNQPIPQEWLVELEKRLALENGRD